MDALEEGQEGGVVGDGIGEVDLADSMRSLGLCTWKASALG